MSSDGTGIDSLGERRCGRWLAPRSGLPARRCCPKAARANPRAAPTGGRPAAAQDTDALFRLLDERIEAAMSRYHIPGVAVGVLYNGRADSDQLKQGVCRCIAECIRADFRKQKDCPAAVFRNSITL